MKMETEGGSFLTCADGLTAVEQGMALSEVWEMCGYPWQDFLEKFGVSNGPPFSKKLPVYVGLKKTVKGVTMPVSSTGFVEGDVLVDGDGGVIKMHFMPDIPNTETLRKNRVLKEDHPRFQGLQVFSPSRDTIEALLTPPPEMEEVRRHFVDKLAYLRHLAGLSEDEMIAALLEYADDRANHRNVGAGDRRWRVEVIALPETVMNAIEDQRVVDYVLHQASPWFYVSDLVSLVSNALKLTNVSSPALLFRRSVWKVSPITIASSFDGKTVVLDQGPGAQMYILRELPSTFDVHEKKKKGGVAFHVSVGKETAELGVVATTKQRSTKPRCTAEWLKELGLPPLPLTMTTSISMLKSGIQKLIRFQPRECEYEGVVVDARTLLVACLLSIVHGNSQFIPHLQVSVRGPTNAAKRLAIIAVEDSYYHVLDQEKGAASVEKLLAAALLAQKVSSWFPSDEVVGTWLRSALCLQASTTAIAYKNAVPYPVVFSKARKSAMALSAWMLRVLRSFEGDMRMLENEARKNRRGVSESAPYRPFRMPWEHVYDQHVDASIAYLLPYRDPDDPTLPFSSVLRRLFEKCTGANPRRVLMDDGFAQTSYVKKARRAQRLYGLLLRPPQFQDHSVPIRTSTTFTYAYTMSIEWVAGAVGVQEHGTVTVDGEHFQMVWTMNPADMHGESSIVPTPKPVVRNMNEELADKAMMDERIQKIVVEEASRRLEEGQVRLKGIPRAHLPREDMYNARVRRRRVVGAPTEEMRVYQYDLRLDGSTDWVPFETYSKWDEPLRKKVESAATAVRIDDMEYALTQAYTGMASESAIHSFLRTFHTKVLQRALPYIRHHRPFFCMNMVSRDGGTKQGSDTVSPLDGKVFELFVQLSQLAPYGLRPTPKRPFRFTVEKTMVLERLRLSMERTIAERMEAKTMAVQKHWGQLHDSWTLLPFQRGIVDRMLADRDRGKSRHFLNVQVGLGKTLMALQYIRERGFAGIDHIVFIAPSSAFGGVVREMVEMGFRVRICTGTKNIDAKEEGASWHEFKNIHRDLVSVHTLGDRQHGAFVPQPGTITMVKHLGLFKSVHSLLPVSSRTIVVCDEVHKLMRDSQKSAAARILCKNCAEMIALTGTPILEIGGAKHLISWLEQICDFHISLRNFVVATNSMISRKADLGIQERQEDTLVPLSGEQLKEQNRLLKKSDLIGAVKLCYDIVTPVMLQQTQKWLAHGVFLVAKDKAHQQFLARAAANIPGARVVCFGSGFNLGGSAAVSRISLHLTEDAVRAGKEEDFNVVVVAMKDCEGYTVTRLGVRITSVYFSNQATREQIKGRLIRITQKRPVVHCITVMAGILKNIRLHYKNAALMSACIQNKKVAKRDIEKLIGADKTVETNKRGREDEAGRTMAAIDSGGCSDSSRRTKKKR